MKTNKILILLVGGVVISSMLVSSSYAMGGNGKGNGNGGGSGMHNSGGNNENGAGGECNIDLDSIEKSSLSQDEADRLVYQYAEEKLARDLYTYFYELYGEQVFANIAKSESEHMAAVKKLLDRYELDITETYLELEDEYEALKEEGEKGLKEALEVGIKIEILDIDDIVKTIKITDNEDIKVVFSNIGGASYNHLRGFLNGIKENGLSTDIDYSDYISDSTDMRGNMKNLIVERLESEGVDISNINISDGNKGKGNNKINSYENRNINSYKISDSYKTKIDSSMDKFVDKLDGYSDDEKLKVYSGIQAKIDVAIEKLYNSDIDNTKKQVYMGVYSYLNILIENEISNIGIEDETESILDDIFE